jgi:hypothetical protein
MRTRGRQWQSRCVLVRHGFDAVVRTSSCVRVMSEASIKSRDLALLLRVRYSEWRVVCCHNSDMSVDARKHREVDRGGAQADVSGKRGTTRMTRDNVILSFTPPISLSRSHRRKPPSEVVSRVPSVSLVPDVNIASLSRVIGRN